MEPVASTGAKCLPNDLTHLPFWFFYCSMFISLVNIGVISNEVTKPQAGDNLPPKE